MNIDRVRARFLQTDNDLQAKLQIKQRELLELKKKKLELELAATQKQLGLTPVSMDSKPSIISQIPDALTKPQRNVMLNPSRKHNLVVNVATMQVRNSENPEIVLEWILITIFICVIITGSKCYEPSADCFVKCASTINSCRSRSNICRSTVARSPFTSTNTEFVSAAAAWQCFHTIGTATGIVFGQF